MPSSCFDLCCLFVCWLVFFIGSLFCLGSICLFVSLFSSLLVSYYWKAHRPLPRTGYPPLWRPLAGQCPVSCGCLGASPLPSFFRCVYDFLRCFFLFLASFTPWLMVNGYWFWLIVPGRNFCVRLMVYSTGPSTHRRTPRGIVPAAAAKPLSDAKGLGSAKQIPATEKHGTKKTAE